MGSVGKHFLCCLQLVNYLWIGLGYSCPEETFIIATNFHPLRYLELINKRSNLTLVAHIFATSGETRQGLLPSLFKWKNYIEVDKNRFLEQSPIEGSNIAH